MPQPTTQQVAARVLLDLDRCIECQSCSAACYYSHADMPVVQFARSGVAVLPLICRQCKEAPCVDACPAEAMVRDDSGVVRRRMLCCVGCGSCARACPFGAIPPRLGGTISGGRSPERVNGRQAAKCDLCADRTEVDGKGEPRCVAACPSGALVFADEHEAAERRMDVFGGRTTGQHPFKRR